MSDIRFELEFLGAAEMVTGSSYLLKIYDADKLVITTMVDHGMFQGPEDEPLNYDAYTFDPASIDYIFLTHAHIDHCGLLPRLAAKGFNGKLLTTRQTAQLIGLILPDSAKIQQFNQEDEGIQAMYDQNDVQSILSAVEEIDFGVDYQLESDGDKELTVKFFRAGHILGAASIYVSYGDKSILFSGDLGRKSQDVVRHFEPIEIDVDYIVMESLYGGKNHPNIDETLNGFGKEMADNLQRNGNVIIPAFSIQRSQEMLYELNKLINRGILPKDVQIIFDSPLAQRATEIYTENFNELSPEFKAKNKNLHTALYTPYVKLGRGSQYLRKIAGQTKKIIVSGSGMCNGGKVVAYLKKLIGKKTTMVALVGFQAEGTLGRELVEGARNVVIDDASYKVEAKITQYSGFSAHADHDDLIEWLGTVGKSKLKKVFLVHAEVEQSIAFTGTLKEMGYNSVIPKRFERFSL